ncbi:MAG TPA: hypothetical protein VFO77_00240 [Actinoplanes sp.]|nr:hypothetical protein [Actinoplanes sp.]
MKMPTFSHHRDTSTHDDDAPAVREQQRLAEPTAPAARPATTATSSTDTTDRNARPAVDRTADRAADERSAAPPATAGPRPRASLLATFALITGVVAAMLVLSGPLVGYGIGLAGVALILSLGGLSATSRRHVAGKSDALIGVALALGAIVVGVLALTGSLSWLGTDAEPVTRLREWLDTQFIDRF